MSGHRKWSSLREELVSTPEGRHRYERAQKRFDRKIRWYKRRQALKQWLGFE